MTKKFRKVRKGGRSRPRVWCSWFAGRRGSRSGPTATTCRPPRGHPPRPSGAPLCTWGGAGSCTERNATHLIKHEAPARPPPPLPPHHFPVVCGETKRLVERWVAEKGESRECSLMRCLITWQAVGGECTGVGTQSHNNPRGRALQYSTPWPLSTSKYTHTRTPTCPFLSSHSLCLCAHVGACQTSNVRCVPMSCSSTSRTHGPKKAPRRSTTRAPRVSVHRWRV